MRGRGAKNSATAHLNAINFMDNVGEFASAGDESLNGSVENHGESMGCASHHLPLGFDFMFKLKQGEPNEDLLILGNGAFGADEQALGADIFYDVPEHPLFYRIFSDNIGGAALVVAAALRVAVFCCHFSFH